MVMVLSIVKRGKTRPAKELLITTTSMLVLPHLVEWKVLLSIQIEQDIMVSLISLQNSEEDNSILHIIKQETTTMLKL